MDGVRLALIDFDGPLCGLFKPRGLGTRPEAQRIRAAAIGLGLSEPPAAPCAYELWRRCAAELLRKPGGERLAGLLDEEAHALLAAAEAGLDAALHPEARPAVDALHAAGLMTAVVSNNAAGAVQAALGRAGLALPVYARTGRSEDLKPSPARILDALRDLRTAPEAAVMIGDGRADVQSAAAAGVRCIACRPEAARRRDLVRMGACAEAEGLADAAALLIGARPPRD